MKQRYRKNKVLEIFEDQQTCTKSLGKVKLIEYLRGGTTFTLKDDPIIWCYERWIVEFIEGKFKPGYRKQHNIRFDFRDIEPDPKILANYIEAEKKYYAKLDDNEEHNFLNDEED